VTQEITIIFSIMVIDPFDDFNNVTQVLCTDRCYIASSTNANYADWADLPEAEYARQKELLIGETLDYLKNTYRMFVKILRGPKRRRLVLSGVTWTIGAVPVSVRNMRGLRSVGSYRNRFRACTMRVVSALLCQAGSVPSITA